MILVSSEEIEPVMSLRVVLPYPMTITSLSVSLFSRITIFSSCSPLYSTSWRCMPIMENCRIIFSCPSGLIVKLPFTSLAVPWTVFFTTTDTPGIGSPFSSTTFPFIIRSPWSLCGADEEGVFFIRRVITLFMIVYSKPKSRLSSSRMLFTSLFCASIANDFWGNALLL